MRLLYNNKSPWNIGGGGGSVCTEYGTKEMTPNIWKWPPVSYPGGSKWPPFSKKQKNTAFSERLVDMIKRDCM